MNTGDSWDTRDKDLSIAKAVLNAHKLKNAESMTLLKGYDINEKKGRIKFSFPEWVRDLAKALYYEHGETVFPFVLSRVLEKIMGDCVIDGKIHPDDAELFLNIVNTYVHKTNKATFH